jgi:hypothetical protein
MSRGGSVVFMELRVMSRPEFWFRKAIRLFAAVLTLAAAWLLVTELIRPRLPYFPQEKDAEQASAANSRAEMAASIGWLRGDLWTDAAITSSSVQIYGSVDGNHRQKTEVEDRARSIARRAARWSPHDSRAWLLLTALDLKLGSPLEEVVSRLKMSYFTGPNETALTALRVRLAIRSNAFTDPELNALVSKEIRSVLLRHPANREALVTAYIDASAEGKQFIEETARTVDKDFVDQLRASGTRR